MSKSYQIPTLIEQSQRMIMAVATECIKQPHRVKTLGDFVTSELKYLVGRILEDTANPIQAYGDDASFETESSV
jgi:hypothetical protein